MSNSKKLQKNDLGFLGIEAQIKIVKALIEDKDFFLKVSSYLNQNAFGGDNGSKLREITGIIKDYQNKGLHATYADLDLVLKSRAKTDIDIEENTEFIKELKSDKYLDGMETAKDLAINFFRQQALMKVLNKGIESLTKNGYQEEKSIIDIEEGLHEINDVSTGKIGVNPIDCFERLFEEKTNEKISTGIVELNNAMNGGLGRGQVGLLIAGTGAGKSTLASIICAKSAYMGYKTLHIYFEESESEMVRKYYAALTGVYTKDMYEGGKRQEIIEKIKNDPMMKTALKNNIRSYRMNNGTTQVEDIRNQINQLIKVEGWKPDLIFIDYFSCLQKSSDRRNEYTNECSAGEKCMKKISQLALDFDIAVWVAEQTNRSGAKTETSSDRVANVQGSYRITQPASFIFYLDRTAYKNDTIYNQADLYMDKCRGCEPKEWISFYMNNGNCQIDLSTSNTIKVDADIMFNEI